MTSALTTGTQNEINQRDRDLVTEFLMGKRSDNTRRAYQKDLIRFFREIAGVEPTPEVIEQFLTLPRTEALRIIMGYKDNLAHRGFAGATINRRVAAIRSLIEYAYSIGVCEWQLPRLKREKERKYRDTTGVNLEQVKAMMAVPDRATQQGKRDYVILRLLWENGLRRGELAKITLKDVDWDSQQMMIFGKGRGEEGELIDISDRAIVAIEDWLTVRPKSKKHQTLLTALDFKHQGKPLTPTSIYRTIRDIARKAGIKKMVSPHRIRHSAITAYLDASEGDMRGGASFARHSNPSITQIYDDNRKRQQRKATNLLSDLV